MKGINFIIACILLSANLVAQRDTLKKIRFSGMQIDIGPNNATDYNVPTQTGYQKIIKDNDYLNADFSTYQKSQNYYIFRSRFTGLAGVKFYADIQPTKKIKREVFIGLRYGEDSDPGLVFNKTKDSTTGTFVNPESNAMLYKSIRKISFYAFSLTASKLIIPIGINFKTDKSKVFWITYGLELSPVLFFNYQFQTTRQESTYDIVIDPSDTTSNSFNTFNSNGRFLYSNMSIKDTKLNGVDFGFTAAIPFSMYLHPFKKTKFLKHINLLASISPMYAYVKSKYLGSNTAFNLSLTTGLRYNI